MRRRLHRTHEGRFRNAFKCLALFSLIFCNAQLHAETFLGTGAAAANPAGLYTFEDTNAPSHPQRVYRALEQ